MSIDLNWEAATSGPDGEELAERIRSFIHDKFQQVPLPRFIRSVQVHSFAFGEIAPELEIKDLCDPFPDFYEEDDEDGDSSTTTSDTSSDAANRRSTASHAGTEAFGGHTGPSEFGMRSSTLDLRHQASLRSPIGLGDHLNSQFRSGSPSILPGGTSNLGYHLMMGNLSGAQTPLAAVASGSPFHPGWSDAMDETRSMANSTVHGGMRRNSEIEVDAYSPSSRPSTANTNPSRLSRGPSIEGNSSTATSNDPTVIYNDHASSTAHTHARDHSSPPIMVEPHEPPQHLRERRPEDFQVICRVKYAGDVKLSLTAEILLDYPMPSFAGLPLKLNITGVTFDGIAVVAYIRRRAHLCFLSPEDADAFEEEEPPAASRAAASDDGETQIPAKRRFGSLLQQIRVESEIGRNESGKQVLKNVGKVERFVLDQVRRIFEDEFVFPSFWTFLV